MKREIKFRAWDEKLKMMTTPFIDFLIFEESENFKKGQVLHQHFEDEEFIPIEIMQFTGLKDKNGNEIYEEDIIEFKHPFKGRYHKGIVEMIDWRWTLRNFYQSHLDIPNEPFCEGTEYIEVIGNIYQNPELL